MRLLLAHPRGRRVRGPEEHGRVRPRLGSVVRAGRLVAMREVRLQQLRLGLQALKLLPASRGGGAATAQSPSQRWAHHPAHTAQPCALCALA
jgi:hypothetical protein